MGGLFSSTTSGGADSSNPSTSSSKLATRDVVTALKTLPASSTKDLIFHLGVELGELDDIERQYRGDVKDQKRHFIDKWIENDVNASWNKLAVGLKKIDKKSLAHIIRLKHSSKDRDVNEDDIDGDAKQTTPVDQLKPVTMQEVTEIATLAKTEPEMTAVPQLRTASPVPIIPPGSPSSSAHSNNPSPTHLYPGCLTLETAPRTKPSTAQLPPTISQDKVDAVRASIKHFKEEFTKLMCGIYLFLSEAVKGDSSFLGLFRVVLLALPISKKPIHRPFFKGKGRAILKATDIDELWTLLNCYCDYKNYEIIMYIIEQYIEKHATLMQNMMEYHASSVSFEKSTTVDVYLCAIKIERDSKVYRGFFQMVLRLNKSAWECTLYEIRQLKESIAESADIHSYGVYIDEPRSGSVVIVLRVPPSFLRLVTTIMTPELQQVHQLTNVTMLSPRGRYIKLNQNENEEEEEEEEEEGYAHYPTEPPQPIGILGQRKLKELPVGSSPPSNKRIRISVGGSVDIQGINIDTMPIFSRPSTFSFSHSLYSSPDFRLAKGIRKAGHNVSSRDKEYRQLRELPRGLQPIHSDMRYNLLYSPPDSGVARYDSIQQSFNSYRCNEYGGVDQAYYTAGISRGYRQRVSRDSGLSTYLGIQSAGRNVSPIDDESDVPQANYARGIIRGSRGFQPIYSGMRNNSLYFPPDSGVPRYQNIQQAWQVVSPIDDERGVIQAHTPVVKSVIRYGLLEGAPRGRAISCPCNKKCILSSSIILLLCLFIGVLWAIIAKTTSLSAIVYSNDVVLIDSVSGYWYNRLIISCDTISKSSNTSRLTELHFETYYMEHLSSAIEEKVYTYTTPSPYNWSLPQLLTIDGKQQNYLLKGSQMQFNFTILDPSPLSDMAKICQFSSRPDYIDDPNTNDTIIEGERNGVCKSITDKPNIFEIEHSGYHWYVVSTLLSPDGDKIDIHTIYEYQLNKLFYNCTLLSTPHECTVNEPSEGCVIEDSLFTQKSTKHLLVYVSDEDNNGYEVNATLKDAVGIALLVFLLTEIFVIITCFFLCVCICKCTRHKYRGLV